MKKLYFIILLLFSNLAFPENHTIRIYKKNPNYRMLINYQICALQLKGADHASCAPSIKNITIKKNLTYRDIKVPAAFYVKIVNVYELNDEEIEKAYGDFPGEEDCKVFDSAMLDDNGKDRISCLPNYFSP